MSSPPRLTCSAAHSPLRPSQLSSAKPAVLPKGSRGRMSGKPCQTSLDCVPNRRRPDAVLSPDNGCDASLGKCIGENSASMVCVGGWGGCSLSLHAPRPLFCTARGVPFAGPSVSLRDSPGWGMGARGSPPTCVDPECSEFTGNPTAARAGGGGVMYRRNCCRSPDRKFWTQFCTPVFKACSPFLGQWGGAGM